MEQWNYQGSWQIVVMEYKWGRLIITRFKWAPIPNQVR